MSSSRRSVLHGLFGLVLGLAAERAPAAEAFELHIASDGDELAFKPDRLTCPAGVAVRLFFHHAGEIIHDPHDWVLLKPGTEMRFLADADRQPDETAVIPPGDAGLVLAASGLCALGETVVVDFVAPPPGDYPFVCSIPGHGETMRGILSVTV
jgi:azurin